MSFSAECEFAVNYLALKPVEFWELTPAEFYEMANGYHKRVIRQTNDNIELAWSMAMLVRADKLPELKSLLVSEEQKHQSDEDMLAVVKMLNAAFGGEVVLQ